MIRRWQVWLLMGVLLTGTLTVIFIKPTQPTGRPPACAHEHERHTAFGEDAHALKLSESGNSISKVPTSEIDALELADIPEGHLKSELKSLPASTQNLVLQQLADLSAPGHDLANSMHTTRDGHLFYVCAIPESPMTDHPSADQQNPVPQSMSLEDGVQTETEASKLYFPKEGVTLNTPYSHIPVYESNPGSENVIFLDFDGHVVRNTKWNEHYGQDVFHCAPMDSYEDPTSDTFSATELQTIKQVWKGVSHHFSAWDINVTTREPEVFDSRTVHVVITLATDLNGIENPASSTAHGVAFVDKFGKPEFAEASPVFVYTDYIGRRTAQLQDIVAHEVGHYLGLSHDGDSENEYYDGHSITGGGWYWCPIMGRADANVIQWSKGEYAGANNTEDDLAIIGAKLPLAPDTVGDTRQTASPITMYDSSIYHFGYINDGEDEDWLEIESGEEGIQIGIEPVYDYYAFDYFVELYDASGNLIDSGGKEDLGNCYISQDDLAPGNYFLRIAPEAWGAPLSAPPLGYTSYGNMGHYRIVGRINKTSFESPNIVTQPASQTALSGTSAEFIVEIARSEEHHV